MTAPLGYRYDASTFCPDCLVQRLQAEGRLAPGASGMKSEHALDQLAEAELVDRADEASFSSWSFPKPMSTIDGEGGCVLECGCDLDWNFRAIAANWHGGMSSPLYAYASTGSLVEGVVLEVVENLQDLRARDNAPASELNELNQLEAYLTYRTSSVS